MSEHGRSDERARRIGLNEGLFRNTNEQLKGLAEQFDLTDRLLLVCECGYAECDQRLRVPPDEYERIRSDPRLFAVAPGHEFDEVEEVLAQHDGFNVVKKLEGVPARVARETDPRSG